MVALKSAILRYLDEPSGCIEQHVRIGVWDLFGVPSTADISGPNSKPPTVLHDTNNSKGFNFPDRYYTVFKFNIGAPAWSGLVFGASSGSVPAAFAFAFAQAAPSFAAATFQCRGEPAERRSEGDRDAPDRNDGVKSLFIGGLRV